MHALKPLSPGDTIGIAAPASPFDKSQFEFGIRFLEEQDFRLRIPSEIFHQDRYLAGSDAQRARLINALFADDSVQAIWCARGGYGALRILPLLDYSLIHAHPKAFVGSSDITAMLSALSERCDMPVFHGPMIVSFADADEASCQAAIEMFRMPGAWTLTAEPVHVIQPGQASGPVAGGNLTTLVHLIGTPYEPDFSGKLLFVEDIGEAPYRIDRMLTQLKLAGKLSHIQGVILGSFIDCGTSEEIYAIAEQIFSDLSIPVLGGIPAGHGSRNMMLPIGVKATLDAGSGTLTYHSRFFNKIPKAARKASPDAGLA
ncbi:MAG TPA: LD-carboxypeptidase [Desulfosalsimonadaceae bacterium]|nr:LD-carboxypeptidase [Desulfosalsimonadaceae bacterium]